MSQVLPYPFKDPYQGVVDASGNLTIRFGPPNNVNWNIEQITLEMLTAPAGATAVVKAMGSLVAPAFSARKAALAGEPPIFLQGGETMTVEWENCITGHIGKVYVIYYKIPYR